MVEWKKLGDFAKVQKTKNKKHITENAYSITQAGLVPTKSFFKEKTHVTSSDTSGYYIVEKDWFVYSPSRIDVGSISFLKDEGPAIVSPIDVVFSIDKDVCLPDYLLSFFFTYEGKKALLKNREGVEGTGRRNLPFAAIESMLIPIPSIVEQENIVLTLDTFTSLISKLDEEIALRKKQYEHYRDHLLSFEGRDDVEWKKLGDVCFYYRGVTYNKSNEIVDGRKIGTKILRANNITLSTNELNFDDVKEIDDTVKIKDYQKLYKNDILICAGSGSKEHVGKVAFISNDIPYSYGGFMGKLECKDALTPRFLFHILTSNLFKEYLTSTLASTTINNLNSSLMINFEIPLIPIEIQQSIISTLDTFTSLISALEQEKALRQKQYEYYREKLLTFE